MATPSINDLVTYVATKIKGIDWNSNFTKIVNWLTDGTADLNVNSLTTTNDLTIAGDITATGSVTANSFIGDGSSLTGLSNSITKNYFVNGGMQIYQTATAYTLVKDTYSFAVDVWHGMATGTAVSAGTLTQATNSTLNNTGYAAKFSGVTLTGTGVLYFRERIAKENAIKLKNQIVSMQFMVKHDVGSSVNYTIYVRKADAANDFTTSTNIGNSGAIAVATATDTKIKYENLSVGDCSNGLEVEIKIECGAITTKNFEITNAKLEISTVISTFISQEFSQDLKECQSYFWRLASNPTNGILLNYYTTYPNAIQVPAPMYLDPVVTYKAGLEAHIAGTGDYAVSGISANSTPYANILTLTISFSSAPPTNEWVPIMIYTDNAYIDFNGNL